MKEHEVFELGIRLKEFKDYLIAKGAEILEPTNEFEALRFIANGSVGIVHKKSSGRVSAVNEVVKTAWMAFRYKKPYQANKISKRVKKNNVLYTLLQRDGYSCFYCAKTLEEKDMTIEHLLSISMGGRNHLANLVVACTNCNNDAGHLTLIEKIKLRERKLTANERNE